jgi:hypothetical protein
MLDVGCWNIKLKINENQYQYININLIVASVIETWINKPINSFTFYFLKIHIPANLSFSSFF